MAFGFTTVKFFMHATIGGVAVPITQFATSYEMNRIPSCTALLPVGYTAATLQASPAYNALAGANLQVPLSVTITVVYVSGDVTGVIPAGTYSIFCGWVTGVGYRRTYNGYALAIEGTHWLSALSFSSALSAASHPNNPSHFIFNSTLQTKAGGEVNPDLHWVGATTVQKGFTPTDVQTDLWGKGILPWFKSLAKEERIDAQELINLGIDPKNDSVNDECLYALGLFDGDELPLDMGGVDSTNVTIAVADDIGANTQTPGRLNTFTGMAHTTLWDKLVGSLAPNYAFAVIPFPTKAKVVPFVPGLREHWAPFGDWSIMARDMTMQDTNAHLPRAVRAYGYFSGYGTRCGGELVEGAGANDDTIGGMYAPADADDGIVILKRAPAMFGDTVLPQTRSADSLGVDNAKVRGNGFNFPGEGAAPDNNSRTPKEAREDSKILLQQLAHAAYVNEALKHRWGDIHGPLRFDICPGSTIKFEGTEGSGQPPGVGNAMYGSVQRVSFFADAQHQKASTSFRLAYIRSEAENQDDRTSVARHPLYNRVWKGDYMLDQNVGCP